LQKVAQPTKKQEEVSYEKEKPKKPTEIKIETSLQQVGTPGKLLTEEKTKRKETEFQERRANPVEIIFKHGSSRGINQKGSQKTVRT